MMQEIWLLKLDWDDQLPKYITDEWNQIKKELNEIHEISIPRWISTTTSSKNELHAFCDASSKALAAVLYIRVVGDNEIKTAIISQV